MAGMRSRDFIFIFKKNSLAQHVQRCKFELFDKFEEKENWNLFLHGGKWLPEGRITCHSMQGHRSRGGEMVARGQNNLSFHAGTQVKRGGNGCQRAE